jgi:membrane protein DedA with SNARE-associated domain
MIDLMSPGRRGVQYTNALLAAHMALPGWLEMPHWFRHAGEPLGHFVTHHQTLGLFVVIFTEELGIPLPAPGDVAIAWAGYQTTTGVVAYSLAYLAVIAGAVGGSLCLYAVARRFGHPFVLRFGRYVGLDGERLDAVERAFRRWGPLAIIVGRHIPGMRIYLSAFAGIFEVPLKIFVPSVAISAALWATIFIEIGRVLGRNSRYLFRLFPAHLFPLLLLGVMVLAALYVAYEHAWRPRNASPQS